MGSRSPRPENEKRAGHLTCSAFVLMRKMGLEPTRLYKHKILSLACLPIPALPHVRLDFSRRLSYNNKCFHTCQQLFQKIINKFFRTHLLALVCHNNSPESCLPACLLRSLAAYAALRLRRRLPLRWSLPAGIPS